jgi:hypothetical protein
MREKKLKTIMNRIRSISKILAKVKLKPTTVAGSIIKYSCGSKIIPHIYILERKVFIV